MSVKASGSGQNRQAQQQDFGQRIIHLPLLPAIWHFFEVIQKNRRLDQRLNRCLARFHRNPLLSESEEFDRFSISLCCHAFFHPIALADGFCFVSIADGILEPTNSTGDSSRY
jgi:hypothetical protein